jgi:hypothetical protein
MAKESSSSGIGFVCPLTIVFVTLKLCKVIDWSWLWVLSPIWLPLVVYVVLALSMFSWAIVKMFLMESKKKMDRSAVKSRFQSRLDMAIEERNKKHNAN